MTTTAGPAGLHLTKLHGLGNDFLVLLDPQGPDVTHEHAGHAEQAEPAEPADRHDFAELARHLCDRHRGVGADGLILGRLLAAASTTVDRDRLQFQLWNADGSEAEMSGNGIRCLAHAALDAGWVDDRGPFGVITPAGRREVTIRRTSTPGLTWGTVDMGPVKIQGEADRCNVGHGQLLVDVGNPHLVVLGPDPATVDVAHLGPTLEHRDPAGLNVEFVTLGPGPDEITMRVWERGVGETEACGTGSCAAAAALHHWGRVGQAVTVHQPGGAAVVELDDDGTARLSGPSQSIATCTVAPTPAPRP